jgi:predicted PurR-regulated permease PerM
MNQGIKLAIGILGAVLFIWGMWYFSSIVAYVLVAAVISLIGRPVTNFLLRLKISGKSIPNSVAALLTLLGLGASAALLLALFAPLIIREVEVLSVVDYQKVGEKLSQQIQGSLQFLSHLNLSGDDRSNEAFLIAQVQDVISADGLSQLVNNIFSVVGNAFVALFSIVFISFFLLKDRELLRNVVLMATPDDYMDKVDHIMQRTSQLLSRYFVGLIVQISIVTLLIALGLYVIGIPNALLIGFLAGLVNLIPYVGPLIGAFIGMFIATTLNLDLDVTRELLPMLVKVAVVFLSVQLLDNLVIQPFIFSNSINAHPLEIFLVISLAGTLAGIAGMVLAVPAYSFFRIVAREFLSEFKLIRGLTRNA